MKHFFRLVRFFFVLLRARCKREGGATPFLRAQWQQYYCREMLKTLDIRRVIDGSLPESGLIVANHLGYLDVLVIAAEAPVCFVAKADIKAWPFIGPLLRKAGTIFVDRDRPFKTAATRDRIAETLAMGIPVVLFPEGTSSDGSTVLPFRPMLLQPALQSGHPITPLGIAYDVLNGDPKSQVAYWGDATFFPHLIRLAGLEGVTARVRVAAASALPSDRKLAARSLHEATSALLSELLEDKKTD